MSTLKICDYIMPAAALGGLNPLPDIQPIQTRKKIHIDEKTITPEEAQYMGWAPVHSILPYQFQDGYNRTRRLRSFKSFVLENDYIKATFLPDVGGRLWSLVDKTTGRELIHKNPVFQPCNLAIRNAWVSGGVEWNIGVIGHSPFTVDRVFAERLQLHDGTPVLRLYQYERIRKLFFRVEAVLPEEARCLYIRVRIDHPLFEDTAVYWWSNTAYDEREDVRVLVPADRSFRYGYGGQLTKVNIPDMPFDGTTIDVSWPTHLNQAMDFFFDLPEHQRRWISAVDGTGYGLIQSSTDTLRGRKLFVWGTGTGGRHWQTFLSVPGSAYFEIQAGLARTQLEHLPMPPGTTISWTEMYGPIKVDQSVAHGKDWKAATESVEKALEKAYPREHLDAMHEQLKRQLDSKRGELLHVGDGWAFVDQALYGSDFTNPGLQFPKRRLGKEERMWLNLIEKRTLDNKNPLEPPGSYQVGAPWAKLLRETIQEGGSRNWFGYYHYGVILAHAGKWEKAKEAFEKSLYDAENPWALRCLAWMKQQNLTDQKADQNEADIEASKLYLRAVNLIKERHLVIEAMHALQKCGRPDHILSLYNDLPSSLRQNGRIKVFLVEALLDLGQIEKAEQMLRKPFNLYDIREGEIKLSDLWFRLCAIKHDPSRVWDEDFLKEIRNQYPPPAHLDFRMK